MKKIFCTTFFLLLSLSVFAQGKLVKELGKGIVKTAAVESALRPITVPQMAYRVMSNSVAVSPKELSHWNQLNREDFYEAEKMLTDYFVLSPEKAPSQEMLERNMVLQEELVRNFLNRSYYLTHFKKEPTVLPVAGTIDYLEYIPYHSRVILLGEMHELDWTIKEVEQAIYQYKNAYPDKNVHLLLAAAKLLPPPRILLLPQLPPLP